MNEIEERIAILSMKPYNKKTAIFIKKEYGKEYLELYHKFLKQDKEEIC